MAWDERVLRLPDGQEIRIAVDEDKAVRWADRWELMYKAYKAGLVRAEVGPPSTYSHIVYYLL